MTEQEKRTTRHIHSFTKYIGTRRPGTDSAMDEHACACGAVYSELRRNRLERESKV